MPHFIFLAGVAVDHVPFALVVWFFPFNEQRIAEHAGHIAQPLAALAGKLFLAVVGVVIQIDGFRIEIYVLVVVIIIIHGNTSSF